jgi:murein DD-endopeptidase MepM/ murein hydrolase activator NlpD
MIYGLRAMTAARSRIPVPLDLRTQAQLRRRIVLQPDLSGDPHARLVRREIILEPRLDAQVRTIDPVSAASPGQEPWLKLEQFVYAPRDQRSAGLRLLGRVDARLKAPADVTLLINRGYMMTARHPHAVGAIDSPPGKRLRRASNPTLWRAIFELPLEVIEYPGALFALAAAGQVALALPVPRLTDQVLASEFPLQADRRYICRARRGLAILAGGLAAGTSISTGAVATASTTASTANDPANAVRTVNAETQSTPCPPSNLKSKESRRSSMNSAENSTSTVAAAVIYNPPAKAAKANPGASTRNGTTGSKRAQSRTDNGRTSRPLECTPPVPRKPSAAGTKHPKSQKDCLAAAKSAPGEKNAKHNHQPSNETQQTATAHGSNPASPISPRQPSRPVVVSASRPLGVSSRRSSGVHVPAPTSDADGDVDPTSIPATAQLFSPTAGSDPFASAQIARVESIGESLDEPPKFLIPVYKAAGKRYHIPWEILAAINAIETDFGRDLSVSAAGAVGWMQFEPSTWLQYAIRVDGHGPPNPYDPKDAIFSAARYLAANGAPKHLRQAILAYNHALWYVDAVLWRAQTITDRTLDRHPRKTGYALPLDTRYMSQLGRIDDGVDIEDAPDGAAVYSITPGVVTAVASDPTGFGPNYPVILTTDGPLAGDYIYYGHVAASLVHVGQRVLPGEPIAVMGHTGDAAPLGHGHIEIGFSDGSGDPLSHHGVSAWTPSGDAMRHMLVALSAAFRVKTS